MLILFCVFIRIKNQPSRAEEQVELERKRADMEKEKRQQEAKDKAKSEEAEIRKSLVGSYSSTKRPGVSLSVTPTGIVTSDGTCSLTFKDEFSGPKNECKNGGCTFAADDDGCTGSISLLPDGTLVLTVTTQNWKREELIKCQACVPLGGQWKRAAGK